jgi:hypothetical protein
MTRTISLIIGIAVAALVAVPTALGSYGLGDAPGTRATVSPVSTQPDAVTYFYANERATMSMSSNSPTVVSVNTPGDPATRAERLRSEGLNKLYGLGSFAPSTVSTSKDANERVVVPQSVIAERLRSEGLNKLYGLGEFAPTVNHKGSNQRGDLRTPVAEPVATSGSDVEWQQIGIGFGIGIALAIALGLSLRVTRHRPLAH